MIHLRKSIIDCNLQLHYLIDTIMNQKNRFDLELFDYENSITNSIILQNI